MMNREQLEAVYDVLVECCGANEHPDDREQFVGTHLTGDGCTEYRFCGALGFGGKFRSQGQWRVDCYGEDSTPERRAMIERANEALVALQAPKSFYVVEHTVGYKVEATSAEEAERIWGENPGLHEKMHEDAGYFNEFETYPLDDEFAPRVARERTLFCDECGEPFSTLISGPGIANHVKDGAIDHDADADHVPFHRP